MELTLSTEEQQLLLDILEQRHRELLKRVGVEPSAGNPDSGAP